jgi:predicted Zn-dependent peptidase
VVQEATAGDLRAFYDTHYHPSNMHLFVVGDIEPHDIRDAIARVYASAHTAVYVC